MEARERLRLLSREMDLQRSWLAAWFDEAQARAARRRSNGLLRLLLSVVQTRSLWLAAVGLAVEWWRKHERRTRAA